MYHRQSCCKVERFLQGVMLVSASNPSPCDVMFDPVRCSLLARKIVLGTELCGRENQHIFRSCVLHDVVEQVMSYGVGGACSLRLQYASTSEEAMTFDSYR